MSSWRGECHWENWGRGLFVLLYSYTLLKWDKYWTSEFQSVAAIDPVLHRHSWSARADSLQARHIVVWRLWAVCDTRLNCTVAARAERHLGSLPCSLLSVSCRISLQPPDVTSFMTVSSSSSSFCEVLAADLITSCNRHLPLMAPPQQPKAGGKPACCLLVCSGEPSAERWGSRVV